VPSTHDSVHRTLNTVWRLESPRIIASVARLVGDVGLAEDLAQDALVTALEKWPETGLPDNPGAWLMTAARRRALDQLRRRKLLDRKHLQLGHELESLQEEASSELEASLDDDVGDDLLRLIFTTCHPLLSSEAQLALTLRLLGGLTTDEIARAFLVPEPTIAQRIVRAKKTLATERVSFTLPDPDQRDARLASVLATIYLIFNEGYAATGGDAWVRQDLCDEAMRLGRILAELAPDAAEVHGLVALMEIQASRIKARVAPDGTPILLLDQNRSRWDHLLIQHGLKALQRAEHLGGAAGAYQLQAAIAAFHARARTAAETDWEGIAKAYAQLAAVAPSPIVELNRAVAVGMARGAAAGLAHVDTVRHDKALRNYHLLPAVRADLLQKLGRLDEARAEYLRAAGLASNSRERALLSERAEAARRLGG
jgi:RNA polymerase sigma factor (sigma-70 family)